MNIDRFRLKYSELTPCIVGWERRDRN